MGWARSTGRKTRGSIAPWLTFGPGVNIFPIWSPDDKRVVFASNRKGPLDLYQRKSSGFQYDVSADGNRFLINTLEEDKQASSITVVQNWTGELG